jgi:DNA-binding beta-propeller fold protein YncE
MDNNHTLVKTIPVPSGVSFVRGFGADPMSHSLYLGYGGIGGKGGHLLRMDLLTNQTIYDKPLPLGSDSFDLTPDGKTIYMPDGDTQGNGIWRVIDAATGNITNSIDTGGHNPHNTIVSLNGKHVYMAPRLSNYLVEADTTTNQIIKQIGPVQSGVRPFTINSQETLAFIETSDFLGFDVADIATGKILYKISIPGKSTTGGFAPTHGISLSPNEKEIYVADWPNSKIHIFDVSGLPATAPKLITDIPVHNMVGNNTPCVANNCQKEGWILHSLDGRFVYVGDAGDIIDTTTHQSIAYLNTLANTRKYIEIDWQNGLPTATSTRYGKGRGGSNSITPPPANGTTPPPQSSSQYIYAFYQNTISIYDKSTHTLNKTITLPSTVH